MPEQSCKTCRIPTMDPAALCPECRRRAAMAGVPPGSGGERLFMVRGIGKDARMAEALMDSMLPGRPWVTAAVVGVRFPASDPDPGRWYRKEKKTRAALKKKSKRAKTPPWPQAEDDPLVEELRRLNAEIARLKETQCLAIGKAAETCPAVRSEIREIERLRGWLHRIDGRSGETQTIEACDAALDGKPVPE